MSKENNKIALFIDFENLETGVRKQFEVRANVEPIIDELSSNGNVIVRRAYGDWVQHANYRHALLQAGVELIERPNISPGKNGSDVKLAIDAVELALTDENIQTFVIVSGNSDFLTLIQKLKAYGRKVLVCGVQACTSNLLRKNCDRYYAYEHIAKLKKGQPTVDDATVKLVEKALEAKKGKTDASALKTQMLQINPSFTEKDLGFSSFNDMIDQIAGKKLIELKIDKKPSNWSISAPKIITETQKEEWEDREMTEEEWEIFIDAVAQCIQEGAGRSNQGKLWIINAYLHRQRLDGKLPLANHILFNALQTLVAEGVLVNPSHDTYLLSDDFEEKKEELLDEMFGVEVEELIDEEDEEDAEEEEEETAAEEAK